MRSYASARPVPVPGPEWHTPRPEVVRPGPEPPRHHYRAWLVAAIVIAGAALTYRYSVAPHRPKHAAAPLRTRTVRRGPLEKTLRLAGVTVAQKAVTMLTPRLWGGRERGSGEYL